MNADPLTHAPGGKPHPQFILDYIAAYQAAFPDRAVPPIWDRGNGWINFVEPYTTSLRRGQVVAMTRHLVHLKEKRL